MNRPQGIYKHLDFIIGDAVTTFISFYFAVSLRHGWKMLIVNNDSKVQDNYQDMLLFLGLLFILAVISIEPYKDILHRGMWDEIKKTVLFCVFLFAGMLLFMFAQKNTAVYSRISIGSFFVIELVMIIIERAILKFAVRKRLKASGRKNYLILITRGSDIKKNISDLHKNYYGGIDLSGIILTDNKSDISNSENASVDGIKVIGCLSENVKIEAYMREHVVDEVYIPATEHHKNEMANIFLEMGVTVHVGMMDRMDFPNAVIDQFYGNTVITASINNISFRQLFIKRIFDILAGIVGSAVTVILMIIVGPMIFITDPGSIFFRQERVGRNGRKFKMWKFRSMYKDAEKRKESLMNQNEMSGFMFKMENDPRIIGSGADGKKHGIGWFIRKFSIDEFPQFFNILAGQMSLVGTRPPTVKEVGQYNVKHLSRLAMKPGLTGLWQVSGRSDIEDFEEVVRLDNEYIRNFSILNDMKIIAKTFKVVFNGEGSK